ncbi:hypothetical protein BGZ81_007974 [Podila clonocystis]|nr:hypothetical protein BGZ81_007974 [Podila clonocystis]
MAPRIPRMRRRRAFYWAALIMALLFFQRRIRFAIIDLGYLTRPLWDKDIGEFHNIIPHYYAEGMSMKERCEAHHWKAPSTDPSRIKPKVYDALVFSVELDMLEIRMRELWDVVDHFIIVESNVTYTGLPKELSFAKNRKRFEFAESKILYKNFIMPTTPVESSWDRELWVRDGVTELFKEYGLRDGDIFISADLDEVPYAHTIELYKSCEGVPDALHLQLQHYVYSFEFPSPGEKIWKTFVHKWSPTAKYSRLQSSGELLTDAGWHCSFCFRHIADFKFKVDAYSHFDRVRYPYMKTPEWIQRRICDGTDLFGMFPEAYTYKDLFSRLGGIPKSISAVKLPRFLLENRKRFRFLLPGGCIRDDAPKYF